MVDRQFRDFELARLYDALCVGREDFGFYLPLVLQATAVLDVGCGTGELLRIARSRGHTGRLVGLDPGEAMLRVAQAELTVEWVPGDLTTAEYWNEFDLVVMTGHAFQVLLTDDDVRTALVAVRRALKTDGHFVFETRNPLARGWEQWAPIEVEYEGVPFRYSPREIRQDGELVSFTSVYSRPGWAEDELSHSTLRFMSRVRLVELLGEAGLRVVDQYGDWGREPLTDSSPEIITVAAPA